VSLVGAQATIAMVHAGWRGLQAGVLDAGLDAVGEADGAVVAAVLGPSIHACCYEFGEGELRDVARGLGLRPEAIRGTTTWGTTALDVPAAIRTVLQRRDVGLTASGPCTGCDERWFSHRCRAEPGRHVLVAWGEAG
jgi:copper oxidase (laccase) domain-containing protein